MRVSNLEPGLRGRVVPPAVTVTVRGTEAAVESLTSQSVEAYVDARELSPGEHDSEVKVRAGPGLTIEGVGPATVRLRIAKP